MMGSKALPVCDIIRGMDLFILRILWLVAQWIIKVEIVSLSPLIISAAMICFLSTLHWALKPGWRLSPIAAPVLENSGNAEKAMKTLLWPKKSSPAALCFFIQIISGCPPRAVMGLELCASVPIALQLGSATDPLGSATDPLGSPTQRNFWVPQTQSGVQAGVWSAGDPGGRHSSKKNWDV